MLITLNALLVDGGSLFNVDSKFPVVCGLVCVREY